jgi:hypothetical protein
MPGNGFVFVSTWFLWSFMVHQYIPRPFPSRRELVFREAKVRLVKLSCSVCPKPFQTPVSDLTHPPRPTSILILPYSSTSRYLLTAFDINPTAVDINPTTFDINHT